MSQKRSWLHLNTHRHAVKVDKKPFGRRAYSTIGLGFSALNYYGDLAPKPGLISTDLHFTRPGVALSYARRKGPHYTIKTEFTYGVVRGDDTESADQHDKANGVYRYRRNLSFRNHIKELSVTFIFDLFENTGFYLNRPAIVPYGFVGLAIFHHNPQAKAPTTDLQGNALVEAGKWVDLQPLGTEGQYARLQHGDANFGIKPYHLIQPSIPGGIGVRIRVNHVADISVEFGFRCLFTDYIDDVSRNYVDLGTLQNELARAMSYRTNELPDNSDLISYTGENGNLYHVVPGYGHEHIDSKRGDRKNNDVILITTIRFAQILNAGMHRAKSR